MAEGGEGGRLDGCLRNEMGVSETRSGSCPYFCSIFFCSMELDRLILTPTVRTMYSHYGQSSSHPSVAPTETCDTLSVKRSGHRHGGASTYSPLQKVATVLV